MSFKPSFEKAREMMERAKATEVGSTLYANLPRMRGRVKFTPEALAGAVKVLHDLETVKPGLGMSMLDGFVAHWCAEVGAELGRKKVEERKAAAVASAPEVAMVTDIVDDVDDVKDK